MVSTLDTDTPSSHRSPAACCACWFPPAMQSSCCCPPSRIRLSAFVLLRRKSRQHRGGRGTARGQAVSPKSYGRYAFEAFSCVQGTSWEGNQSTGTRVLLSMLSSIHDSGTSQHGPAFISPRIMPSSMVSDHCSDYHMRSKLVACLLAVYLQRYPPSLPRVVCDQERVSPTQRKQPQPPPLFVLDICR
ncbi:uncharacterized protein LY79DRAFT_249494 [Colletotrichum navitas]|uniref:Uncharacterized protein n=1 Tax=Colletotrichum navitas TaxID=681940 RepID=A0AAD8QC62_9PEZI|nr:uncharacterized protein LY79DRAFT_249494 [Colletotrichum navitas]KAK1598603.1 hypothetical protein LY79DRAFT_249494 [Colletotrichum navitas]